MRTFPILWENKTDVPNHQPACDVVLDLFEVYMTSQKYRTPWKQLNIANTKTETTNQPEMYQTDSLS